MTDLIAGFLQVPDAGVRSAGGRGCVARDQGPTFFCFLPRHSSQLRMKTMMTNWRMKLNDFRFFQCFVKSDSSSVRNGRSAQRDGARGVFQVLPSLLRRADDAWKPLNGPRRSCSNEIMRLKPINAPPGK